MVLSWITAAFAGYIVPKSPLRLFFVHMKTIHGLIYTMLGMLRPNLNVPSSFRTSSKSTHLPKTPIN